MLADVDDRAHVLCVFDGCHPDDSIRDMLVERGSIMVLPKQTTLGSVLNAGISRVSTEFIARIDADDLWPEGRLDGQLAVMRRNPEFPGGGWRRHSDRWAWRRARTPETWGGRVGLAGA